MPNPYTNQLNNMLENPGSFQGTPGFQFALNTGMQGVERQQSRNRGSGNALAALAQYGTGLAQQDWGNQVDRLGRLQGQQNQFNLGEEQNRMTANRDANNFTLGQGQNATTAQRDFWNYDLGREQNSNIAANNRNTWGRSGGGRSGNGIGGGFGGGMTPNWNMGR